MKIMQVFRGRTDVNIVLNNHELEVDSCGIETELVTHDFILPSLLYPRKETDDIAIIPFNSDTKTSSVEFNLLALTNLSEFVAVIEFSYSVSSKEREFIFTQIHKINAKNLFKRFSKANSDPLRHSYQRLDEIGHSNIASQIYAVNEKSFCPVNEEYRAKYIQGYVKKCGCALSFDKL